MTRLPNKPTGKPTAKPAVRQAAKPGVKPGGTDERTAKIVREMIGNLKANANPRAARAFDDQKAADEGRFLKAGNTEPPAGGQ